MQRPPHSVPAGRGSAANVIAAICSFFLPGLGQLVQGRLLKAAFHFLIAGVLWLIGIISFGLLTWLVAIIHIWSCYEAAVYRPRQA